MASEYSDLLNKHFAGEHVEREDDGVKEEEAEEEDEDEEEEEDKDEEEEDEEAWLSDAVKGLDGKGWDEVQGLGKGELVIQLNEPPAVPALTKKAAEK